MSNFYKDLEDAVRRLTKEEPVLKGKLGYKDDSGEYTVLVPSDLGKYYVRFPDGQVVEAFHKGSCSPTPDLPVVVVYEQGYPVIRGTDVSRSFQFKEAGNTVNIGMHTHARNSGYEFDVDTYLLKQLGVRPLSGMTVYINSGFIHWQGSWQWWNGGSIDLTPYIPPDQDTYGWVIVGINVGANSAVAVASDPRPTLDPLQMTDIDLASFSVLGHLPLAAVKLINQQTSVASGDIETIYSLPTGITTKLHQNYSGQELHKPGYFGPSDPGSVGEGHYWIDTSAGLGNWQLKVRNSTNDGWELLSSVETLSLLDHPTLTGSDLHVPGYMASIDPGAVGAGHYWVDTSLGSGSWTIKVRNAANDGWETLSSSVSSSYYQSVSVNGTTLPQQPKLNLVAGAGVTISGVDDPANNESDITISASGSYSPYTYVDIIYVSQDGNDTNAGTSPESPKLTISAAITAASALTPAADNRILIKVIDAARYTEDITTVAYVSVDASAATLIGQLTLSSDSFVYLDRHYAASNNQIMVNKSGGSGHGFYKANIQDGRGLAGTLTGCTGLRNVSNGSVLFAEVGVLYVPASGVGVADSASGFGHIHFWTPDLYLAGNSAIGIQAQSNATNFIGYIDHLLEISSPTSTTAISCSNANAIVKTTVSEIIADTAINLTAGNVHVQASKVNGDITVSSGANLYINSPHHSGTITNNGSIYGILGQALYNAAHDHQDAEGGGQLTDAALSAPVGIAKGGTGGNMSSRGPGWVYQAAQGAAFLTKACNFAAFGPPEGTETEYSVGSFWHDVLNYKSYICTAVLPDSSRTWIELTSLSGGGESGIGAEYTIDNPTNYATTSSVFTDVDPVNASLTITTTGGDVLVGFHGNIKVNGTGACTTYFDVTRNGNRVSSDDGMFFTYVATGGESTDWWQPVSFTRLIKNVPAGTHEFNLQWKVVGTTGCLMHSGSGEPNLDMHPQFWVYKMPSTGSSINGAMVEIAANTILDSNLSGISLTNIPTSYSHLMLMVQLRSDRAGQTNDGINMTFNGDTGFNYAWGQAGINGVTVAGTSDQLHTSFQWSLMMPGGTGLSGAYGSAIFHILNYAQTGYTRSVNGVSTSFFANNAGLIRNGQWFNTADPVTQIDFASSTGSNFVAGSSYSLYGIG